MPSYDPIIGDLVTRLRGEVATAPTFADAHADAVAAIRRLESTLQAAIDARGADLNLPNLGSQSVPVQGLRLRGHDPARKLDRVRGGDPHSATATLILCEDGELRIVEARMISGQVSIGDRAATDLDLWVEDLIGMVRAVSEALRRNADLVERIDAARALAAGVMALLDGREAA